MSVSETTSNAGIGELPQLELSYSAAGELIRASLAGVLAPTNDGSVSYGALVYEDAASRLTAAVERAEEDHVSDPQRMDGAEPQTVLFARMLLSNLVMAGREIPAISVDPDGQIGMDWEGPGFIVALSINAAGLISYAAEVDGVPYRGPVAYLGVLPTPLSILVPRRVS